MNIFIIKVLLVVRELGRKIENHYLRDKKTHKLIKNEEMIQVQ